DFARRLAGELRVPSGGEVAVAPAFTALQAVGEVFKGTTLRLAAQNVHDKPSGAYTGEVSAAMLVDAGCIYVIIGHSERRSLFGETDEFINRKIAASLSLNLMPIFCIGETLGEREGDETFAVLERQIREGLKNLSAGDIGRITIAYEPVWAIGTGRTASPGQAQEVHGFVRKAIDGLLREEVSAQMIRILYGGSVNSGNISALMGEPDIDGALVGGASLELESFSNIVNYR
ncbi:MAG: triose-phosphate isomerase, partial [Syntrophales bacterium]|nr:triose-phosphate isomerase [Syntrophales bacterium]